MLDLLLTLSSKLNNSSQQNTTSSPSSSSSSSTNIKKFTLKQLIQVNESILDSLFHTKYKYGNNDNDQDQDDNDVSSLSSTMNDLTITAIATTDLDKILRQERGNGNKNSSNNHDEERKIVIQNILKQFIPKEGEGGEEEEELEKCQSILLSHNSNDFNQKKEERILMVVQYVLRLSTMKLSSATTALTPFECSLSNIINITYPLLLSTPNYSTELRDAILEASFLSSTNNTQNTNHNSIAVHNSSILSSCLDMIQQSISTLLQTTTHDSRDIHNHNTTNATHMSCITITPEWIAVVLEFSCRLLTRILQDLIQTASGDTSTCTTEGKIISMESDDKHLNQNVQSILDVVHQISISILSSLCYYSNNSSSGSGGPLLMNGRTSTMLRIVTSLLLPCLMESPLQEGKEENEKLNSRMLSLWDFIHDLIVDNDNDHNDRKREEKSQAEEECKSFTKRKCRTWQNTAPSVASGVLCIIVQSISSLSLPLKKKSKKEGENLQTVRLSQHPAFWNFIKKALHSEATINVDSRGMKGGGTFLARSGNDNPYSDDNGMEDDNVGQLVRRRSIHILHLLIEKESNELSQNQTKSKSSQSQQEVQQLKTKIATWKKYILCFEALEMEEEAHLVDQVWDTVVELCAACSSSNVNGEEKDGDGDGDGMTIPSISWDMVGSLFARVLLSDSPTLRKLGLFRLLTGRAGIALNDDIQKSDEAEKNNSKKKGKKSKKKSKKKLVEPSPISIVSPSFILEILVPSFDSLSVSGFNFNEDGKTSNYDLSLLIRPFITIYCKALMKTPAKIEEFMKRALSEEFISSCRVKTLVLIFKAIQDVWTTNVAESCDSYKFKLSSETINGALQSFYKLFYTGSIVFDYRVSLLLSFSIILSNAEQPGPKNRPEPLVVLELLTLYVSTDEAQKETEKNELQDNGLREWLVKTYGEKLLATIASSCAAAFVSGQLVAFSENQDVSSNDKLVLTTDREREMGSSISKLCSLVGSLGLDSGSSMLWPAINKGLTNAPVNSNIPTSNIAARQAARALILLQSGCRERILNGIGHGDLLVDKKGNMVPPPPTIENLLSQAVYFLIHQMELLSICGIKLGENGSISILKSSHSSTSRSGSYLPNHFALIINQLMSLKRAYPSSVIMTKAVYELLTKSLKDCTTEDLCEEMSSNDIAKNVSLVKSICLLFGTLTFGTETLLNELAKETDIVQCCSVLLRVQFKISNASTSQHGIQGWQIKAMRSIFQHAKWGSLSLLLPQTFANSSANSSSLRQFHDQIIDTALDAVNATPIKGILALFGCVITAAKNCFNLFNEVHKKDRVKSYIQNMTKIIDALFTIMDDTSHNPTRSYMLQCTCSLIFRPERLMDEYNVFQLCKEEGMHLNDIVLPIRSAFRKMIKMAGTHKPHISQHALSYISFAWIGNKGEIGLSAIPYREDIARLLIHKEAKLDEANTHRKELVNDDDIQQEGGMATLPTGTPDTSIARGFLLTFISSLPNVEDDLPKDTKTKLCYYLILWLLDEVCLQELVGAMVTGATQYCQILRAWQSLCLLSRFVTSDIAELVCQRVFKAMSLTLPGQIRYFVEIFTIQCARRHQNIFGKKLVEEIKKIDVTPQYICSLMIIAGNLTVGKFSDEFINCSLLDFDIKEIIAAAVPWLGSTQSFCRAIAQLLAHKLIPLAFPSITKRDDRSIEKEHKDWFFVKNTWTYLDQNSEMKKLRNKQLRFFESYETDSVCTPEGIFGFTNDEVDESNPPYMVDVLKRCLLDIGNENAAENPEWKMMEEILRSMENEEDDTKHSNEEELVNFQRKILPVDTLNLTLEKYKQQKLQNAAGRNRQSLIVCASLIDKVTNLAGITRTAEIFAADKVMVPDSKIRKMDNFKSISVGAGEWVTIEECKENNLLRWLKQCKKDGYTIIGVEQTSSSKCLSHVKFEGKSVLLLGKEKEGIPQQFLNIVDQCVEIPQLGVIRSLNVHVSAAICIWEYTKQMM